LCPTPGCTHTYMGAIYAATRATLSQSLPDTRAFRIHRHFTHEWGPWPAYIYVRQLRQSAPRTSGRHEPFFASCAILNRQRPQSMLQTTASDRPLLVLHPSLCATCRPVGSYQTATLRWQIQVSRRHYTLPILYRSRVIACKQNRMDDKVVLACVSTIFSRICV
jgi:hypothetical protein